MAPELDTGAAGLFFFLGCFELTLRVGLRKRDDNDDGDDDVDDVILTLCICCAAAIGCNVAPAAAAVATYWTPLLPIMV